MASRVPELVFLLRSQTEWSIAKSATIFRIFRVTNYFFSAAASNSRTNLIYSSRWLSFDP